jgi:hypothetical protein
MDEHRQSLMNSLERARDSLLTSVEGVNETLAATGGPVLGDWTLKDILAHLVSWGDELRSEIREILIDPTPHYSYVISSDRDYDEWNQSQVAAKKSLSLREILDGLERDYQETLDLIKRLAPDDLQRRGVVPWRIEHLPPPTEVTPENSSSMADLVKIHIQHIEEHSEEIRRWRRQGETPA